MRFTMRPGRWGVIGAREAYSTRISMAVGGGYHEKGANGVPVIRGYTRLHSSKLSSDVDRLGMTTYLARRALESWGRLGMDYGVTPSGTRWVALGIELSHEYSSKL